MRNKSCAEEACGWQGIKRDANGEITSASYPGHDNYQNGVIPYRSDSSMYCTKWYDGQPGSGYFTDQGTVDSCIEDGRLNSNKLGESLQTMSSNYGTNGGDFQHKPYCTAYSTNWDKLDELKDSNSELYGRLTNPDGLSPDNNGIKCAYGKATENIQHGRGGGNQYYIDQDTFNEAVKAEVFKEDPVKSFSEEKGNLVRADIPNTPEYENNMLCDWDSVVAKESRKDSPTPDQINGYQVTEDRNQPFIAKPDEAYGYGPTENIKNEDSNKTNSNNNELNSNNINAPPSEGTEPAKQQAREDGISTRNGQDSQYQPSTGQSVQSTPNQQPVGQSIQGNQNQQAMIQGAQENHNQPSMAQSVPDTQNQPHSAQSTQNNQSQQPTAQSAQNSQSQQSAGNAKNQQSSAKKAQNDQSQQNTAQGAQTSQSLQPVAQGAQHNQNQQSTAQSVQNGPNEQPVSQSAQKSQSHQPGTQSAQNTQSHQPAVQDAQNTQKQGSSGMSTIAYDSSGGSSDNPTQNQSPTEGSSPPNESVSQSQSQQCSGNQPQGSDDSPSQSSSGGMSTTAAESQSGNKNSSNGMPDTAIGESSGPAPSSGSQSGNSGISM